jgi:hypothetical protein
MSAERVGKLLGCDRKYVDRARGLLAKDGLFGRQKLGETSGKKGGLGYRQWPPEERISSETRKRIKEANGRRRVTYVAAEEGV